MRLLSSCLIVVVLFLAPLARADDGQPSNGRRSFKGWELYGWQDGAEWRFSLLVGTNRLKFCDEVKSPKGALDLTHAEEALGGLAEMEYVSFIAPSERLPQASCPLARPPSDMVERLRQVCRRRKLHCMGWDMRSP